MAGTARLGSWWGTSTAEAGGPDVFPCSDLLKDDAVSQQDRSNAESVALDGLMRRYCECNPTMTIELQSYADRSDVVERMKSRQEEVLAFPGSRSELVDGLPDVVQLNAGDTSLDFSACSSERTSILAPLPPNYVPQKWRRDLGIPRPPMVREDFSLVEHYWVERHADQEVSLFTTGGYEFMIYERPERWIEPYISCSVNGVHTHWVSPISVHHLNRLYYNKSRVSEIFGPEFEARLRGAAQINAPKADRAVVDASDLQAVGAIGLEEWVAAMEAKRGATGASIPLALPTHPDALWALSLLAEENVRVALAVQKGLYAATNPESPEPPDGAESLAQAFDIVDYMNRLRAVSNVPDATAGEKNGVTAEEAMAMVERGEALFTVMGDWAAPFSSSKKAGTAVEMIPFPGTQTALVYTIDGFVTPAKSGDGAGPGSTSHALAWLRAVGDSNTAHKFATAKNARSINEWMQEDVRACAYNSSEQGQGCVLVPALSMNERDCSADASLKVWLEHPGVGAEELTGALYNCQPLPLIRVPDDWSDWTGKSDAPRSRAPIE